jgi:hypothetical protein
MNEKELARKLEAEGFSRTFVWQDGPNMHYPDHTHDEETAHIILGGEMTLTIPSKARPRPIAPANAAMSRRVPSIPQKWVPPAAAISSVSADQLIG